MGKNARFSGRTHEKVGLKLEKSPFSRELQGNYSNIGLES